VNGEVRAERVSRPWPTMHTSRQHLMGAITSGPELGHNSDGAIWGHLPSGVDEVVVSSLFFDEQCAALRACLCPAPKATAPGKCPEGFPFDGTTLAAVATSIVLCTGSYSSMERRPSSAACRIGLR
jgi:hypothetical protein